MGASRRTHFGVSEVVQSLLIRCISLLEIFHHEEAMALFPSAGLLQCTMGISLPKLPQTSPLL